VRGLQPVHRIGGAQFAGLDDERKQSRYKAQQEQRVSQPPLQP
jgi:hypothetical protein